MRVIRNFHLANVLLYAVLLSLLTGCLTAPSAITPTPALSSTASSVRAGSILNMYQSHASIFGVSWSPDGKRIVSGGGSNTVQVRDVATGNILLNMRGHRGQVWAVAWSPDGKRIASASWDGTAQVWDATNGHHLLNYRGHTNPGPSVAWSPDSQQIVSAGSDDTAQVWTATTGKP